MGTFYSGCVIENHVDRKKFIHVPKLLVDTGSEYTWISETMLEKIGVTREKKDLLFVMDNGQSRSQEVSVLLLSL